MKSHNEYFPIYTDGSKSSRGVGFAAICSEFRKSSSLPIITSVYTAELLAIKTALNSILKLHKNKIIVYSDSLSAIDALKSYLPKHPIVLEIQVLLHKLKTKNISVTICWIPAHIGLRGNEDVDKVAKEAINKPCLQKKVPCEDILAMIKPTVYESWQEEWHNTPVTNKLRSIKASTKPWPSSTQNSRHHEVILTRLRIGHTNLTHGHLMSTPHGPPPTCDICHCLISVKHVLIECPKYVRQRSIFNHLNVVDVLAEGNNFSLNKIISFLKSSLLLSKI